MPSFETKKDYIARRLREKILAGEYAPGHRLKTRQLAEEFGTSEIPVREAINQLASTGLVTIIPHVGAMASPISSRDLEDIFQIRTALESLATQLAAPRLTAEDFEALDQINRTLAEAVDAGRDADALNQLNRGFHLRIYQACSNRRLLQLIEELWNHAGRYPAPLTGKNSATYQSVADHWEILAALKARDGQHAAALTEAHKARSMTRILTQVRLIERQEPRPTS
jgi:DNA-binding GntR family transcriptional regulator